MQVSAADLSSSDYLVAFPSTNIKEELLDFRAR